MTNQTILSLLNYLCNEARNSVQASFGLMALGPNLAPDPAWQACLENSKCGADRLLRCIDDIRELLSPETPAFDPAEEFDLTLCSGRNHRTAEPGVGRPRQPFNPAIGRRVRSPGGSIGGPLSRRSCAFWTRSLNSGARGMHWSPSVRAMDGEGAQFEIVPANPNIALRVADWLNADPDQINFEDSDEVLQGVATLVAGKRIRALGGTAEFVSDARAPMALVLSIPWQADVDRECPTEPSQQNETGLSVLVAEDSDESFVLTGMLLQKESVWRARDGLEAVDMMKSRRFDVVLMDIHMPGLDGYKAIRSMRDWETKTGNARTPIVVLSSDDLDTQMRSAAHSGCSGFLRKPLDHHDLLDLLDRLKAVRSVSA